MASIKAQPFRLALLQIGHTGPVKASNIELAREAVSKAASSSPKPHLIVLPEIWNSPYAVTKFREYSEKIPDVGKRDEDEGETVKAMRKMAKDAGCWLIGGEQRGGKTLR
jgi:predicted amidohydrolase